MEELLHEGDMVTFSNNYTALSRTDERFEKTQKIKMDLVIEAIRTCVDCREPLIRALLM